MSARYTNSDLASITAQLDIEAKQAGILPMDHKLVYSGGNQSNGISATVMVKAENGAYTYPEFRFIPEFNWKTTRKEQYKLIEAAVNVFYALRLQRERAAK
jgi:hypothetical protein